MKTYTVRYEKTYSTVVMANSEEEACSLVKLTDFNLDETTDFEAEEQE